MSTKTKSNSADNGALFSAFSLHQEALYEELKRVVSEGQTSTNNSFHELWEAEVSRVEHFLSAQQQHLEFSAKALLRSVEATATSAAKDDEPKSTTTKRQEELQAKANQIVESALELQKFASRHQQILLEIAAQADKSLAAAGLLSTTDTTSARSTSLPNFVSTLQQRFHKDSTNTSTTTSLQKNPWSSHTAPQSTLVVVLSDIYQLLRDTTSHTKEEPWVAPSFFERSTTKFWVPKEHLTDLLLHAVQEAPLLVYGQTGRLTDPKDCLFHTHDPSSTSKDKLWDELATPISSVYLDNPTTHILYTERLKRREGAQLLRARWYGSQKPTGQQPLFLELKTHHEKWINTKSVKERVTIQAQDIKSFLDLSTTKTWTMKDAQTMIRNANPNLDATSLHKDSDRLWRMRQLVEQHELKPCVRSVYQRAAFQSSQSNSLRLTVDRNVTVMDESQLFYGPDEEEWCLPHHDIDTTTTSTASSSFKQLPFVVLEVKLAGPQNNKQDFPPLIQDLQQRGIIMEAAKFSKFLTGASIFHPRTVPMLPYWADHAAFCTLYGLDTNGRFLKSKQQQQPNSDNNSMVSTSGASELTTDSKNINNNKTNTVAVMPDLSENMEDISDNDKRNMYSSQRNSGNRVSFLSQDLVGNMLFRRRRNNSTTNQDEEATTSTAPLIAPKRPARVEPKSYFANERTFIQWISAGLLLVTISVILLGIDSNMGSTSTYARKAGIGVCGGAVLIVFYATFVYFRRLRLLSTGSPYGYVDHVGPFVLATSVCIGVMVLLTHFVGQIEFSREEAAKMVYLHEEQGQCYLHNNRGISKLEYQPSDVALDPKRDILLVPTLQRIVSHSLVAPLPNRENRVNTLVEIPNSNLEAVTVVEDRVFALSEGPTKTELIELFWNENEELEVSNRWKIGPSQQAEGMTYVPDKTRRSGRLFIDVSDQVQIYNLPDQATTATPDDDEDGDNDFSLVVNTADEVNSELDRIGSINRHVLHNGLLDVKVSSMFYFEGIAYILHDNEMIVRAWDLDEGDLLAEIQLPRVEGGFSKEWEGIALERREIAEGDVGLLLRNPSLRGTESKFKESNGSQLIMHLALDTPSQVWSINVKEGEARGNLILPRCAVNSEQNRNLHTPLANEN